MANLNISRVFYSFPGLNFLPPSPERQQASGSEREGGWLWRETASGGGGGQNGGGAEAAQQRRWSRVPVDLQMGGRGWGCINLQTISGGHGGGRWWGAAEARGAGGECIVLTFHMTRRKRWWPRTIKSSSNSSQNQVLDLEALRTLRVLPSQKIHSCLGWVCVFRSEEGQTKYRGLLIHNSKHVLINDILLFFHRLPTTIKYNKSVPSA